MKKNIIIVISAAIVILTMGLFLLLMQTENTNNKYTEEEMIFKDEYENLNGTDYGTITLKNITIDYDNNVKYIKDEEIINELKNGTKVIYLGWPECNWCRTMLPILVKTLKTNEIDTLYYYNFKELRNAYEEGKNKDKVKIYEDIIEIIGEDITSTFNEDSKKSGQKKILAPTVIFIRDGNYIGLHVKTIDSQTKSTDELNKQQIQELENIYEGYINQLSLNMCIEEGC